MPPSHGPHKKQFTNKARYHQVRRILNPHATCLCMDDKMRLSIAKQLLVSGFWRKRAQLAWPPSGTRSMDGTCQSTNADPPHGMGHPMGQNKSMRAPKPQKSREDTERGCRHPLPILAAKANKSTELSKGDAHQKGNARKTASHHPFPTRSRPYSQRRASTPHRDQRTQVPHFMQRP